MIVGQGTVVIVEQGWPHLMCEKIAVYSGSSMNCQKVMRFDITRL